MFSIYTWFVDQETATICREPKIAILGDDPNEWKQDILLPWEYHLVPGNSVLIDLVQPFARRAAVEEHIAHVIITQRPVGLHSILFSMEFVDVSQPSVVVNFAIAVPRQCTARTFADTIPLFDSFSSIRESGFTPQLTHRNKKSQQDLVLAFMFRYFQNRINIKPNFLMTSPPFCK